MIVTDDLREAELNRLLRRVDWRFLLPNPRPARSICFADGLLAQAVAAVSGDMIEPITQPIGVCDLAVAVNPTREILQAAWTALRPGGACYMEWHSPLAGGPASVRQRLEAAGFTNATCYWTWPWPDRGPTLFWLPMEAPTVVRYYLANRAQSQSLTGRVWSRLLEMIWGMSLKLRLLAPLCVTARKPRVEMSNVDHASVTASADVELLEMIRDTWSTWSSDPAPQHLSWSLLTRGARSINKVVGMVFAESDRSPCLVVKLSRTAESAAALDHEATNLRAVQISLSDRVCGVPQVLFLQEWAGQQVLGETALAGRPLYAMLRRDNCRDLALKVTDWLTALVDHGTPCPRTVWWDRLIQTTVDEFEQNFGPALESEKLRQTHAILATLGDLPLACEQRDCSPWNVLIADDGELVILDWESAEPCGLPALDLIYFLTYLIFFLDGAMESHRFRESYRTSRSPATFTGRLLEECLQRYATRTGIDPMALAPLRLFVWLIHSRSEYQQLAAASAGRPDPTALRRSLFVSLWEEELAHAIAAG